MPTLSQKVTKASLDKALSNLVWPCFEQEVFSKKPLEVPSSLNDAALPSPACFQIRESSQGLPDHRNNSHQVQG